MVHPPSPYLTSLITKKRTSCYNKSASRFLLRWIQTAEATNIPELQRFAKTLRNHADQLINDV
ncbi:MAG: transposase, partial [Planctomycetaceae bacterium]|nr:transposase [Planctomycetaceae bacterium]